jgi:ABC-type amino acid transport substrate-binding protein
MKRFARAFGFSSLLAVAGPAASAASTLTVCLNENAPPYSSRAAGGFDLAVATAVAKKLDRKLDVLWFESKLDEDSSATLESNALLSDGKCQLVAGYPLTEDGLGKPGAPTARLPDFDGFKAADRRRRIPLGTLQNSTPYHFAALTIVVGGAAASRTVASLQDLEGVKIGVEGGTLSDTILMTHAGGKLIDDITHLVPGRGQLWPSFERGDFDAALLPLHRFDAYRAAHPGTKLKASGYLFPVGFNIGFVGLSSDDALIAEVDAAIAPMLASGEIAALAPEAGMTYLPPRAPDVQKHLLLGDLVTR